MGTKTQTEQIVAPHNGIHKPVRREYRFRDLSNLPAARTYPTFSSTVSEPDGSIWQTEYASQNEYSKHRNAVFDAIAKFHKINGVQPGCLCKTCR